MKGEEGPGDKSGGEPRDKRDAGEAIQAPPAGKSSSTVTPPPAKTAPPANAGKQPAP